METLATQRSHSVMSYCIDVVTEILTICGIEYVWSLSLLFVTVSGASLLLLLRVLQWPADTEIDREL